MIHLKIFEEFTENTKNTPVVYMDKNLVVKVPKTLDSTKHISDPQWCTNSEQGFYKHNLTANLFRFTFSDGYKLRLTWDYMPWDGGYSSGTHWGSGGEVNGIKKQYFYIRPKEELNPFDFYYDKGDSRQEMVDRIKSIPKEAIDKIVEYQRIHDKEKKALNLSIKRDLEKIKIDSVSVEKYVPRNKWDSVKGSYKIVASYYGKVYNIECRVYPEGLAFDIGNTLRKDLKNKYVIHENRMLNTYLTGSVLIFLSTNIKKEYRKIVRLMDNRPKSLIRRVRELFNIEW